MHDEACPTYTDMINNMMKGHEFITEHFGAQPRIGWQIDPFGHSNTNARLFAEMGFDAIFFARIDYQDKKLRQKEKSLEWIWIPNNGTANIFTHTLFGHYSPPPGFNFDILGTDL